MSRLRLAVVASIAFAGLIGCQSIQSHSQVQLSNAVHWYRDSAEQKLAYLQTYRLAASALKARAQDVAGSNWGVILDVDETVLDNSDFQKNEELAGKAKFDAAAWRSWVELRKAAPLPGAVDFTRLVHDELGGRVILVTNRDASVCQATRDNLAAVGVRFDRVLCDALGDGDKNPRFRQVQTGQGDGDRPLRIVMWIGDNVRDFPDQSQDAWSDKRFGVDFFLLPNPMYGSWTSRPIR